MDTTRELVLRIEGEGMAQIACRKAMGADTVCVSSRMLDSSKPTTSEALK